MKREQSIKRIKKEFEKTINYLENTNSLVLDTTISSKEDGIKFLKISIELEWNLLKVRKQMKITYLKL